MRDRRRAGIDAMRSILRLRQLFLRRFVHKPLDADHVILVAAIGGRGAVARPRRSIGMISFTRPGERVIV